MSASKDSSKDRELRYLRRDSKKEHDEAMKKMAELKAVQAQKEELQKLVQSKEDELRKTQAYLVSSYRVQVGKDQEKAQSEKDSHSKNRGGKKTKLTIRYLYHETYRKPNEQLFSQ